MRCLLTNLLLLALGTTTLGYSYYKSSLPNGDKVPDPCSTSGATWSGVGHWSSAGGGARNPFGVDFAKMGRTWTEELCKMDSDGDGKSNGEELGDPNCVWKKGATPARTNNLSHPGLCEPVTDQKCLDTSSDDFKRNCDALRLMTTKTPSGTNMTTSKEGSISTIRTLRPDPAIPIPSSASRWYMSTTKLAAILFCVSMMVF